MLTVDGHSRHRATQLEIFALSYTSPDFGIAFETRRSEEVKETKILFYL